MLNFGMYNTHLIFPGIFWKIWYNKSSLSTLFHLADFWVKRWCLMLVKIRLNWRFINFMTLFPGLARQFNMPDCEFITVFALIGQGTVHQTEKMTRTKTSSNRFQADWPHLVTFLLLGMGLGKKVNAVTFGIRRNLPFAVCDKKHFLPYFYIWAVVGEVVMMAATLGSILCLDSDKTKTRI